ncbi:hypothetical protein [Lentzea aerocolonigenes]|uniref:hypothetical protein n=1 Tax=Lentzea aerocolonigenes TaxID=68170 RepID=UPI0012DEC343|nr:hypothetical protein [Lentzea aerocolonigenes]MCP2247463.1 hypothetical protein [Lentzea aerocolonigenes]
MSGRAISSAGVASIVASTDTAITRGANPRSSPDSPHNPTCRDRDYDMASYSLFRTIRARFDDEDSPYRLEPKQSFHAFRRFNR